MLATAAWYKVLWLKVVSSYIVRQSACVLNAI